MLIAAAEIPANSTRAKHLAPPPPLPCTSTYNGLVCPGGGLDPRTPATLAASKNNSWRWRKGGEISKEEGKARPKPKGMTRYARSPLVGFFGGRLRRNHFIQAELGILQPEFGHVISDTLRGPPAQCHESSHLARLWVAVPPPLCFQYRRSVHYSAP